MVSGPTAWNAPDFYVGKSTPLSAYQPYPANTGTNYSSTNGAIAPVVHWVQPAPVVVSNVVLMASLNAGPPAATSQASAGSEAFSYGVSAFLYGRQDYASNSTNLSPLVSASFGLTATMTYTSTSQLFGMSWVTDSAGGTSNLTTTSADAGWSNFISGPVVFNLPMVTTLVPAEYWMAFQHSSTASTSNSAVTLLSVSQLMLVAQQSAMVAHYLGGTATNASVVGANLDVGAINTPVTFSTTMAQSKIALNVGKPLWFALSNA